MASSELRIVGVARWWPHTHGDPALYRVRLIVGPGPDPITIDAGRVGFRSLAPGPAAGHDISRDGLFVQVNGQAVFSRGALWTPLDSVGLAASPDELRAAIETARDAGMNMLRLPGFGAYEQAAFHDLCDELGVMVWQDLMFMSLDYPFADEPFSRAATGEVAQLLEEVGGRPSLAVLCGNSEVEQQVAMLGLDPALARIPFFDAIVPGLVEAAGIDAIYLPSAPFGGDLPIRPNRGVTNYYGVGGYRAPLSDARTSGVLFAAECLAFANVPDEAVVDELAVGAPHDVFVHDPRWKAGVARDAGAGWDFDDMRDHYFELLYGLDPGVVRRGDPARYVELSRAVTGEVMELVYGEWRRAGSPSGGGLILWLRDLVPGAGWGVVDHHGRPKTAYHHLRRILAPSAVWLTDERTGGVVAHVANDGSQPLAARLRIGLYSDQELPVGAGEVALDLPAHGSAEHDVEAIVGRFVDASWAYRFGPPAQDVIVASLEQPVDDGPPRLLSQAFLFPAGRPLAAEPVDRLGLSVRTDRAPDGVPVAGDRHSPPGLWRPDPPGRLRPGRRCLLDRAGWPPDHPAPANRTGQPWRRRGPRRLADGPQPEGPGSDQEPGDPLVTMTGVAGRPIYLATRGGPIFGIFHEPWVAAPRSAAVLICGPWGWDDIASYRSRKAWAESLAEHGHPTLRIDLPGTGDSAGSPDDAGLVESWLGAIGTAAGWLADGPDAPPVALIGLGLGGLLGAAAISGGAPVDDLVLWAVPASGRSFVREQRAFAALQGTRLDPARDGGSSVPPSGDLEVSGFVLSAGSMKDLERACTGPDGPRPAPASPSPGSRRHGP